MHKTRKIAWHCHLSENSAIGEWKPFCFKSGPLARAKVRWQASDSAMPSTPIFLFLNPTLTCPSPLPKPKPNFGHKSNNLYLDPSFDVTNEAPKFLHLKNMSDCIKINWTIQTVTKTLHLTETSSSTRYP